MPGPSLNYQNAKILAPMVRIGTLPTRLLALRHGADIVYCEEIIDYKMLQCKRVENELLGTIDYVWSDGTVVFRTCPEEKDKIVFQIGTADAQRAVKVAKLIEQDVATIDVNMGCPKSYSTSGGMGAALLEKPERIKEILEALVKNSKIPVTCKIRILPKLEDTLSLVRMIESTGVAALAVHGRLEEERPRHPCHNDIIKTVADTVNIPIIANGGSKDQIKTYEDISRFQASCGANAVMIARSAQWNPSIFNKQGLLPRDDIIKEYLKIALQYDNVMTNVKYCVQQLMHENLDSATGQALQAASTVRQICELWDMGDYYDQAMEERKQRSLEIQKRSGGRWKRRKLEDGTEMIEAAYVYNKRLYPSNKTPKMILYEWTKDNDIEQPSYSTVQNPDDKMFHSVLTVNGAKYASTIWDKAKRPAEQAAASICLQSMGMDDGRIYQPEGNDEYTQPLEDFNQLRHDKTSPVRDSPKLSHTKDRKDLNEGQNEKSGKCNTQSNSMQMQSNDNNGVVSHIDDANNLNLGKNVTESNEKR